MREQEECLALGRRRERPVLKRHFLPGSVLYYGAVAMEAPTNEADTVVRLGDRIALNGALPDALIRAELERIVTSQIFRTSDAQRRFLQYIVEQSLIGNSNELKEYTLGVHVFNRGTTFDPRLDPIVRVEARKLRARLAKYYDTEGCDERQVKIELPSGGYIPRFRDLTASSHATVPAIEKAPRKSKPADRDTEKLSRRNEGVESGRSSLDFLGLIRSGKSQIKNAVVLRRIGAIVALLVVACLATYAGRLFFGKDGTPNSGASIAVLPLQDLGDNKDESFSDGLTDELIDSLGRVQGLQVVARSSAFQFRGKTADVREIGKKLNVRTLLEGSVRIYGNRLRVTVVLEDTTNGFRIWSNSYERNFEDVLLVQRNISEAVVTALRGQLAMVAAPQELKFSPAKTNPVNVEAYQDYLKGLYFWNKQTKESIETAKNYFERSIELAPAYAPSYTGLARCYVNLPGFSRIAAREVTSKIRELAEKAVQLDSSLSEAHIQLAYASFLEYKWAQADTEFKRGVELAPSDAVAHRLYSTYLSEAGRLHEALAESQTAQQLDPVSPYMFCGIGVVLHQMHRYDESINVLKRALELDPKNSHAHLWLGRAYIEKREYPQAIAELKLAQQSMGDYPPLSGDFARAYALSGKRSEALQILNDLLKQAAKSALPANSIAAVYAALGDKDNAMAWLAMSVRARDIRIHLISAPAYDGLRSDTRFGELLAKAHLPPQPLTDDAKSPNAVSRNSVQR